MPQASPRRTSVIRFELCVLSKPEGTPSVSTHRVEIARVTCDLRLATCSGRSLYDVRRTILRYWDPHRPCGVPRRHIHHSLTKRCRFGLNAVPDLRERARLCQYSVSRSGVCACSEDPVSIRGYPGCMMYTPTLLTADPKFTRNLSAGVTAPLRMYFTLGLI